MATLAPAADHARVAYDAFAPYYDAFTAHHNYDDWTATLERLARECGLSGTRLLDVACGTGKSFMPFLERGYEVTACDLSPAMLAIAAEKAGGRARLELHDARSLPRLGEFDLVCCLDDALNYVLSVDELVDALAGLRRNLAPGGVVVFDLNSAHAYRTFFGSLTVLPSEDRVLMCDGHAPTDFREGGLAHSTIAALIRGEQDTWQRVATEHYERHHPEAAVRAALERAGLACVALRGMRLDGSVTEGFDEDVNTKAVYIARGSAPKEEGR
jgi:SAM-dependent methyltransferase